jgi:hypothetical protein
MRKNKKLIVMTWRKKSNIGEFTGLSTALEYLIYLFKSKLNINDIIFYTIEDFDSTLSKTIAGIRYLSTKLLGPNSKFVNTLRETRYLFTKCNIDITSDEIILVDHARGLLASKSCLQKFKSNFRILFIQDFFKEYPYPVGYIINNRLIHKKIKEIIQDNIDFIITSTKRDYYLYSEVFPHKPIVYLPHIYPPPDYSGCKDKINNDLLIINIVHRSNVDDQFLSKVKKLIKNTSMKIIFRSIGKRYNEAEFYPYFPSRSDYLRFLSEGHVGINYSALARPQSGSNVKRYDYALACNTVFTHHLSITGEPLPREFVFIDVYDFATKLSYFSIDDFKKFGLENYEYVMRLHSIYGNLFLNRLQALIG